MTYLIQRPDFYVRVTNPEYFYTTEQRIKNILNKIHERAGVHPNYILSKSRMVDKVEWRQILCYVAYKNNYGSIKEIGRAIGNYDHATIIHAKNKIADLIEIKDSRILEKIKVIEDLIKPNNDKRRSNLRYRKQAN